MNKLINTKIPKPAPVRPGTKSTTASKQTTNVKENIPQLRGFPVRPGNLRRSKSFNDAAPTEFKMPQRVASSRQPLATVPEKLRLDSKKPVPTRPLLRRSASAANLRSKPNKPPIIKPLRTGPVKSVAGPSQMLRNTATVGRATKRPADTKFDEASKPKVAKPMKPAPYDFKARFNLLQEKHTSLLDKFKEVQQRNRNLEEENSNLELIQNELENLKKEYKRALDESSIFQKDSEILKVIEPKLINLEAKYEKLEEESKDIRKYAEIMESENDKLQGNVADLTEKLEMYQKCLKEREDQTRILHNTVQDLKGNIRVFCRVRPAKENELDRFECDFCFPDENTLEVRKARESFSISGKPTDLKQEFTFDRVFPPNSRQVDVFEDLAQLVQSALDGYHVCVFAYGQTGSGKTFTMQGENSEAALGMIPRSINLLFKRIGELSQTGWEYTIGCSFLEIYNENIKDLLNPTGNLPHDIRFNEGKGITVTNLTRNEVSSMKELMQFMFTAQRNRAVAATDFNEHSSRSHFVAKIYIQGTNDSSLFIGSLNLVDLAGSESAKTSSTDRIVETKNINKSLSTLGNVMLALHNKDNHVPYRNSKLTYLLQSCLGGNSKTLMFVNISPFEDCYNETINSLRFAAKVKEVKTGSKRNKVYK